MQKYYKNVSDQTVQDVITLAKELRDIPVKYFEAKPQRAVSLDEVMAVAVPNNVSEDLMNKLNERHIPTYIYEHDNTENRKEIVNNIAEEKNIKFSYVILLCQMKMVFHLQSGCLSTIHTVNLYF